MSGRQLYVDIKCALCNSKLVLIAARRGANKGSEFYGCANYTICKYTVNKYKKPVCNVCADRLFI